MLCLYDMICLYDNDIFSYLQSMVNSAGICSIKAENLTAKDNQKIIDLQKTVYGGENTEQKRKTSILEQISQLKGSEGVHV